LAIPINRPSFTTCHGSRDIKKLFVENARKNIISTSRDRPLSWPDLVGHFLLVKIISGLVYGQFQWLGNGLAGSCDKANIAYTNIGVLFLMSRYKSIDILLVFLLPPILQYLSWKKLFCLFLFVVVYFAACPVFFRAVFFSDMSDSRGKTIDKLHERATCGFTFACVTRR
jgi:hypothetical protein